MGQSGKVLILNGGWTEIPLIEEAKKLGLYVITTGNRPEYPGHRLADKYIKADYSDINQIRDIVEQHGVSGIISCAHDFGYLAASCISEQMGWPGYDSFETTKILHRKDTIKNHLNKLGIGTPEGRVFTNPEEAGSFLKDSEYPVMIKAVDLASGVGISKANSNEEAIASLKTAFDESRCKSCLIEEYIEGRQQSYVSFIRNRKVVCDMSCDCYSMVNPYLIQTETMPGYGFDTIRDELKRSVEKIADSLKLVDGILTLQYIIRDGKIFVIELMRRCLGNQFLEAVTKVTGFPWYRGLVMAELGMDCTGLIKSDHHTDFGGWFGIMTAREGRIKRITIPDEITEHVYKSGGFYNSGDLVKDHRKEKLGFLYFEYDNRADLDRVPEDYTGKIEVEFYEDE